MLSQRMEIKVAILGNVSAGKTTVLNALLRNKYGEAAKKRTTAGASYFYLNAQPIIKLDIETERSVESIYQEIKVENQKKVSNGHEIYKKDFEIEILEPLVCCRQDTVVVVVDIPGINEAGNDNKYKEFVSNHWKTFDCVIIVMDGKAGVNTEDQISLLNFVKTNNMTTKKHIPIIILCNKIDNPDDEEQEELVNEARKEVEKIFDATCRERSLQQTLAMTIADQDCEQIKFQQDMSPAFIPISASNAYIYRCGSQSTLEDFHKLDIDVIDGFGRNQFGQKLWKTLSKEERLNKVYSIVSDPEQYNEGMNDCNFDALLKVLEVFIGGESRQTSLLQQQVQMTLDDMSQGPFETGNITEAIRSAYKILTGLGTLDTFSGGTSNLQDKFWTAHTRFESNCFLQFTNTWPKQNVSILAGPMEELILYFQFVNEMNSSSSSSSWENEKYKILEKGERLVCLYFKYLLKQNELLQQRENAIANKVTGMITSYEWFLILESILLLSYNEQFCHIFGRTKMEFSYRLLNVNKNILEESFTALVVKCPKCHKERDNVTNNRLYGVGLVCTSCKSVAVKTMQSQCFQCNQYFLSATPQGLFGPIPSALPEQNTCYSCQYVTKVTDFDNKPIQNHSILQQNYKEGLLFDDGILPIHPTEYKNLVRQIYVPNSLSDSNHFGHLPYIYCKLAEQIGMDNRTSTASTCSFLKWKKDIVNEQQQQEQPTTNIFVSSLTKPKQKFTSQRPPHRHKKASNQTGTFSFGTSSNPSNVFNFPACPLSVAVSTPLPKE